MKKVFVVLMMGVLLLTACQPTPAKEIVVNKGDSIIDKAQNAKTSALSAASANTDAGQWKENITDSKKNFYLNIDAQISRPKDGRFSIYSVEPAQFSEKNINRFDQVILNHAPLYELTETKAQINQDIMSAKKRMFEEQKLPADQRAGFSDDYIASLQKDYDQAIDKITDAKPATLTYQNIINKENVDLMADMGGRIPAKINFKSSKDNKDNAISYSNHESNNIGVEYAGYSPNKLTAKLPYDTALQTAQKTIAELGLTDMKLNKSTLAVVIPLDSVPANSDLRNFEALTDKSVFNAFCYTKNIADTSVSYVTSSIKTSEGDNKQYAKWWGTENIRIIVGDDNKIVDFLWQNPMKVGNAIVENVKIKPFDEIKQIFKDQMLRKNVFSDAFTKTIYIKDITLGYAKVLSGKKSGEYILTPVWDFYGYKEQKYNGNKSLPNNAQNELEDDFAQSILTVNAIDGSIIDRSKGY